MHVVVSLPHAAEGAGDLTAGFCTPGFQALKTETHWLTVRLTFRDRAWNRFWRMVRELQVCAAARQINVSTLFQELHPAYFELFALCLSFHFSRV